MPSSYMNLFSSSVIEQGFLHRFLSSSLLQYVVDILERTLAKYQEISFLEAENNTITERTRRKLIFTTVAAFQTFVLKYGWHHLNDIISYIRKTYDKIRGKAILKRLKM